MAQLSDKSQKRLVFNLNKKNAIVSGGSSGIGGEISISLLKSGCKVFIFSRDLKRLNTFKKKLPKNLKSKLFVFPYDACDNSNFDVLLKNIKTVFNKPHILVNNVGGGGRWGSENFELTEKKVWDEVISKNLEISYLLTMFSIKGMMDNNWGRIVNISSIFGKESGGRPWFNISKAAQIALNKNLSRYHKVTKKNITFNSISPGAILTKDSGWEKLKLKDKVKYQEYVKKIPRGIIGRPIDVANLTLFLCSEYASHINGSNITVDGGESISY